MAAISAATVNVDAQIHLPDNVQRLRALELAVEARGNHWSADEVLDDAGKYLAFLKGDSST